MARNYPKERYDRMRALGLCHRKGPKGNWAWVDPANPVWPDPKPKPKQPNPTSLVFVPEYNVYVLKKAPFTIYRKAKDELYIPLRFRVTKGGGAECYIATSTGIPCFERARAIALALIGPRPAGAFQLRFRDGNKLNCNPANLFWYIRDPSTAEKYYAEFRQRNVFLQYGKKGTPGAGQRWTRREIAEKLKNLKPQFRVWKPEYAPVPPSGRHHNYPRKKKD